MRAEETRLDTEIDEILAIFGERLLPRKEQYANNLSYANRRPTEIARALAAARPCSCWTSPRQA